MSSSPPPVFPATEPLSGAYSSSVSALPNDYGPLGVAPAAPGVSYFGEPASRRWSGSITLVVGVVLSLFGLLALFGSPIYGVIFTGLGGLMVYMGWQSKTRGSHRDYICDGYGLTIREKLGKVAQPMRVIPWMMVAETTCDSYQQSFRSGEYGTSSSTVTYYRFSLILRDGSVVTIDEKELPKLSDLIQVVNASTPHLPYRWVMLHLVRGLPVRATVGKFAKIIR